MKSDKKSSDRKSVNDFRFLSHQILSQLNCGVPKIEFLREISKLLLCFSGCDTIELWLRERDKYTHYEITRQNEHLFKYEIVKIIEDGDDAIIPHSQMNSFIDHLRVDIIRKRFNPSLPMFTAYGSYWAGDVGMSINSISKLQEYEHYQGQSINGKYSSLAIIPLIFGNEIMGLIQLMSNQLNYFTEDEVTLYEEVAQTFGIALVNQRAQAALRERVKELTCLYSIAQVAERRGISLDEILNGIVELLPPAWQYPESTIARIILDKQSYATTGFREDGQKQTANITINGKRRGIIEVIYMEDKPELDEGPFLSEERSLIDAIAGQIGLIVERKEAEKESTQLQEQLRHADRLATIGQLAAGVAHELNEPLGNILGFAQLANKCPELPEQASRDIDKIVGSSLHAREIIKKLMIFARQMPPKRTLINLNKMVEDELYLFEARCVKAGIELIRSLSLDIPKIAGDHAQLNQVLVNLVVNAIQAMPDGGKLTIKTYARDDHVIIIVEDTGIGMSEDIKKKIFVPFFTTKDVNEGTGLGLAVVHGIVTSHKGSIKVHSIEGQGATFEIRLPVTPL